MTVGDSTPRRPRRAFVPRSLLIGVALAALVAVASAIAVQLTGALNVPEQESVNARFSLRGAQHPTDFIVVAASLVWLGVSIVSE